MSKELDRLNSAATLQVLTQSYWDLFFTKWNLFLFLSHVQLHISHSEHTT